MIYTIPKPINLFKTLSKLLLMLLFTFIYINCSEDSLSDSVDVIDSSKGNRVPVIGAFFSDQRSVGFGESIRLTVLASDPDGDTLKYYYKAYENTSDEGEKKLLGSFSVSDPNDGGELLDGYLLASTYQSVYYTTPTDRNAIIKITVEVADFASDERSKGGVATNSVLVTVSNSKPSILSFQPDVQTLTFGEKITLRCSVNDSDDDDMTYSISSTIPGTFSPNTDGEVTSSTINFTFSNYNEWGPIQFTLSLVDSKGNSTIQSTSVVIEPIVLSSDLVAEVDEYGYELLNFTSNSRYDLWVVSGMGFGFHYGENQKWNAFSLGISDFAPYTQIVFDSDNVLLFYDTFYKIYKIDYNASITQGSVVIYDHGVPNDQNQFVGQYKDTDYFTTFSMASGDKGWAVTAYGTRFCKYDGTLFTPIPIDTRHPTYPPFENEEWNTTDYLYNYYIAKFQINKIKIIDSTRSIAIGTNQAVFTWDGNVWKDERNRHPELNNEYPEYEKVFGPAPDPYTGTILPGYSALESYDDIAVINPSKSILLSRNNGNKGDVYVLSPQTWPPVKDQTISNANIKDVRLYSDFGVVMLIGKEGKVYFYDQGKWSAKNDGIDSSVSLKSCSIVKMNDIYVCGDKSKIYHYDGSTWSSMNLVIYTDQIKEAEISFKYIQMITSSSGWAIGLGSKNTPGTYLMMFYYDNSDPNNVKWIEYPKR